MVSSLFSFQHHDNVSQSWAPEDCRAPGVRRMREKDPRQVNLILMSLFKKKGQKIEKGNKIILSILFPLVPFLPYAGTYLGKVNPSLLGTAFDPCSHRHLCLGSFFIGGGLPLYRYLFFDWRPFFWYPSFSGNPSLARNPYFVGNPSFARDPFFCAGFRKKIQDR